MEYGLDWQYSTTPTTRGGHMTGCDCGATPEEQAAGRHYDGCNTAEGPADHPSDHYGQ